MSRISGDSGQHKGLSMGRTWSRREALRAAGMGAVGGAMWVSDVPGASGAAAAQAPGQIAGQREGAQAGATILEAGGNAVDAIVTAAFTACVVAIPSCGIGGYGGHLVVASSNGRDVSSVDFNSEAPAAARPDMYPLGPDGKVVGNVQNIGWRSVGVPGTLAGLERALTRYGRLPLRDVLEPAIRYCRTGVPVGPGLARAIQNSRAVLSRDPGASALLLPGGEPPAAGSLLTNPALGELLATLAARNSVRSFYEGDIAVRLAEAFARHDGLVTAADLAAYQARDVKPLALRWGEYTIHTAPLTAGGLSVLQALQVLQAGDWPALAADSRRALHFRLEALRTVWHDRLALLGDPQTREVPTDRLLSTQYARETAARVGKAVAEGRQLAGGTDGRSAGGTIHLSAVDRDGSMAAMTLTHGEGFGGRVAAGELGLLLGHGLSRFD
ncbi:MAG: hypothetical protein FJX77_17365, partial [Armatimonadetes bacterium]|nr:hypothetical protein [Armatimonadota bacterium]